MSEQLLELLDGFYERIMSSGGVPGVDNLDEEELALWNANKSSLGEGYTTVPDIEDELPRLRHLAAASAPLRSRRPQAFPTPAQRLAAERRAFSTYNTRGEEKVTERCKLGDLHHHQGQDYIVNLSGVAPAPLAWPHVSRRLLRTRTNIAWAAQGRLQWWISQDTWEAAIEHQSFPWLHLVAAIPHRWKNGTADNDAKELVTMLDLRNLPSDLARTPVRVGNVSAQESGHELSNQELRGKVPAHPDPIYPGAISELGQVTLLRPLPYTARKRLHQEATVKFFPNFSVRDASLHSPFVAPNFFPLPKASVTPLTSPRSD